MKLIFWLKLIGFILLSSLIAYLIYKGVEYVRKIIKVKGTKGSISQVSSSIENTKNTIKIKFPEPSSSSTTNYSHPAKFGESPRAVAERIAEYVKNNREK